MRLKSLEITGFKSFAKKSKFDFSQPITEIVGPNGSGKSNVVEAFRFVLGEQSMKSLRGKSGKDLIFKGSKSVSKMNRAKATIVFDNKARIFKIGRSDDEGTIDLNFDEIEVSREVFSDGENKYFINGSQVRLKDILEMLVSVNIGSSGHHIISQGQADKILMTSSKERRTMIEDALGLKIYQYKIKESERKIERTKENIKEIESAKRELAPHIRYLKKQVEKIEKGEQLRKELSEKYSVYIYNEDKYIKNESDELSREKNNLTAEISKIEKEIHSLKPTDEKEKTSDHKDKERSLINELDEIRKGKAEIDRAIGRIEGMIELFQKGSSNENIKISEEDVRDFSRDLVSSIDRALDKSGLEEIKTSLRNLRSDVMSFQKKVFEGASSNEEKIKDFQNQKEELSSKIKSLSEKEESLNRELEETRKRIKEEIETTYKDNERRIILESEKSKLNSSLSILDNKINYIKQRKVSFDEELREANVLVGQALLNQEKSNKDISSEELESLRKDIEKTKIRLEDLGTDTGENVMKEYREVTERQDFLLGELEDLQNSMRNLEGVISELKDTLETEFKTGMERINERFDEFFRAMFGGGNAFLFLEKKKKTREKITDDGQEIEIVDEDGEFENGIEINVSLPHKKVKELTMLSGGERSLTSIALLFAISQVNPPPFLVLDETDAALDEANSRRYGDMIEKLSKYSQLIVVTHNRETMSRADFIYGVTIGGDGSSKLLSIKFQEAESYAK